MNQITSTILAIVILNSGSSLVCRAACLQLSSWTSAQEKTPTYVIRVDSEGEEKNEQVREFIWHHWQKRQPGSLAVTWFGLEGQASEDMFTFGADEQGAWSLKILIVREPRKGKASKRIENRAYSVERVQVPAGPHTDNILIPDDANIPGSAYRLILRDKDNKKLMHI